MKMQIEELLWEITNKCNRNCSFCGSKEIINVGEDSSVEDKYAIAEQVGKNAKHVTISGGEPFVLGEEILSCVVQILKSHDTEVAVVTNGDLLNEFYVDLFDAVGISINSKSDIDALVKFLEGHRTVSRQKLVLITNVNKINYFDLEYIFQKSSLYNLPLQFQLTMYKEPNEAMINGQSISDLRDRIISLSQRYGTKFIFADNLQEEHTCSAGLRSCGVLYNGDVVPCLSERSWKKEMDVQGNILTDGLFNIWIDSFKECRFSENQKCCRDCFEYTPPEEKKLNDSLKDFFDRGQLQDDSGRVMLYGVTYPRDGSGYPPFIPPSDVVMYGVFPPDGPQWYTNGNGTYQKGTDETC